LVKNIIEQLILKIFFIIIGNSKLKYQLATASIIILSYLGIFFSFFYSEIIIRIQLLIDYFYAIIVVFLVITLFLKNLLFSHDELYQGDPDKDHYIKAFQYYWPSNYISEKFNITKKEASYIWFSKYFNCWKGNDLWKKTLQRGFCCRYNYYLIKQQKYLISIIVFFILLHILLLYFPNLITGFSFSIIGGIIYLVFLCIHFSKIHLKKIDVPHNLKGPWKKFQEINEMHHRFIDENSEIISNMINRTNTVEGVIGEEQEDSA
jgi:hypothetical protein